jgi:hypothetical protein
MSFLLFQSSFSRFSNHCHCTGSFPYRYHNILIANRVAGFVGTVADPQWFVAEQIALSRPEKLSPNATVVALQLGNMYLLAGLVAIGVLYSTSEPKVVRNYLIALWLADIGHVGITYYILEYERFVDVANWNAMAWGNIGITVSFITILQC